MMQILGIVIFFAFACIWYIPVYKRLNSEGNLPKNRILKDILWGIGPAFFIAVAIQIILGWIFIWLGAARGSLLFHILNDIFAYALIEELVKGHVANRLFKKSGYSTKGECILIFGAVGLGFGIIESLLVVNDIFSAVVRGVFALHVFFQLFMGYYVFDALECRNSGDKAGYKKNMLIGMGVPILVHSIHDVCGSVAAHFISETADSSSLIGVLVMIFSIAVDIVFLVITLKRAKKA